jgi:hypothetical protein
MSKSASKSITDKALFSLLNKDPKDLNSDESKTLESCKNNKRTERLCNETRPGKSWTISGSSLNV